MTHVEKLNFGSCPDERPAHVFTLTNSKGWTVELTDIGAAIRSICVPDKSGKLVDVVLCHHSFEDSLANQGFFGSTIGRVANRISGPGFVLDGKRYILESDNDSFQLHGGVTGFSHLLWAYSIVPEGIKFTCHSPDGDQGYPGAMDVSVTYTWNDDGCLGIAYHAVSDADTLVNLTNHAYFNLNGYDSGDILSHIALLDCDKYMPVNENICVTGEHVNISGTDMDFTTPHTFGERIYNDNPQLKYAGGYDFSFTITQKSGFRRCAEVIGPETSIALSVYTDQPAVHLYTGNMMTPMTGKNGKIHNRHHAFCLETQHFPDAVNLPGFPPPILRAGEEYVTKTEYVFRVC